MQTTLNFDARTSAQIGMQQAEWKEKALAALKEFLYNQDNGYQFRVEVFREWCEKGEKVPAPNSKRIYGSVIKTAQRLRIVEFIGTDKVTNPNANGCFCGVWVKI